MMETVQLGRTDLIVSRICFGCWQLSEHFWGKVEVETWEEALDAALELGVNFIDTADAYGNGYSESCLGAALKKRGVRDRVIVATKFLWNFEQEERHMDTRHDYILRECEASLKRLQTDRIDLYQIHSFDPLTRPEEVAAAMLRLKQEGKVRWFGVSNLSPEQMRMYRRFFDIHCLQPPYSLLRRDAEKSELPYCLAERIGVIPYSPLYRGMLTGKYARDHVFTDARKNYPLCAGAAFQRIQDGLDALRPIAERMGLTLGQLAIRWVLTHPAVTSAIVGIKTREHIETIVPAADDLLPIDEWHRAAGIMDKARQEAMAAEKQGL